MALKAAPDARQKIVPEERIGNASSRWKASKAIPIPERDSVVLVTHARPPPPAAPARAERARDHRRGGRRAAVHAVGGVAAARPARAGGGGAPARARWPRGATHRRRPGACGT